jgi:hypothetical protein
MAGLWDKPGIPHKGWEHLGVTDLEDDRAHCQMCDKEDVRFVHTMEHEDYGTLDVGCVCAGKMCEDYDVPRERERIVRNRSSRRTKWLTRRWNTSANGNYWVSVDGVRVVVFRKPKGWSWVIAGVFGPYVPTIQGAKLAAFDHLNSGK